MDAVDVYKLLLNNKIGRFPSGFWQQPEARQNAIKCIRFLIEELLGCSDEDIRERYSFKQFRENSLMGMLASCFNSSPYEALSATYPGKFQPWELKYVPSGYWNDINNGIEATRWLIETKLGWSDEDVRNKLSKDTFLDNGLGGMLNCCFKGSPYRAIDCAYPQRFKPSDFKYQRILND